MHIPKLSVLKIKLLSTLKLLRTNEVAWERTGDLTSAPWGASLRRQQKEPKMDATGNLKEGDVLRTLIRGERKTDGDKIMGGEIFAAFHGNAQVKIPAMSHGVKMFKEVLKMGSTGPVLTSEEITD